MSVLDASALVELLLDGPHARWVAEWLDGGCTLHLADAEVVAAIAGLNRGGHITRPRARAAVAAMEDIPIERFPLVGLLPHALRLAASASAYDAAYLALAAALDEPLVTLDRRLARGAPRSLRVVTPGA